MDIYGEIILDHFKNPRRAGLIKDADLQAKDLNPLCGDKVEITAKVDEEGRIVEFGFLGDGCAISVASTSLLGEKLIGRKLEEVMKLETEDILKLLEIPISAGRIKCALLGFSCLKKAATIYNSEKK